MTDTKEPEKKEEEEPIRLKKGVYTECPYCHKLHKTTEICPELIRDSMYPKCRSCGYIYDAKIGCICTIPQGQCDCGRPLENDGLCAYWPMCDH